MYDADAFAKTLDSTFGGPIPNEELSLLRSLKAIHNSPHAQHVTLVDSSNSRNFPISAFLQARGVHVDVGGEPKVELVSWDPGAGAGSAAGLPGVWVDMQFIGSPSDGQQRNQKGTLVPRLLTGVLKFRYNETDFTVYKITWMRDRMQRLLYDFVFNVPQDDTTSSRNSQAALEDTPTPGHALISDIYRWAGELKDEIWVFQGGQWTKDRALWEAIRNASWDDIVLEEEFLEGLRRDTRTFFENRAIYKELGVVWKRGILLLGPPGNGKTESIKVLLKESGQAALYVKSFTTPMGAEAGVKAIFDHARANAPCILVIEDLDSLVTPNVRSFFLNELDGLGQNEGILTVATTNHPERIDDAILNRPSRFDVKYEFALPTEALRTAYALKWIRKMTSLSSSDASRVSAHRVTLDKDEDELAKEVAEKTDGFSFAFLKELFVSFLLRLAHDKTRALARGGSSMLSTQSADAVLLEQAETLSKQILVIKAADDKEGKGEQGEMAGMRHMRATMVERPATIFHAGPNF